MKSKNNAKSFVARIMRECEEEGLTLEEVSFIASLFDLEVKNRICAIKSCTKFTAS